MQTELSLYKYDLQFVSTRRGPGALDSMRGYYQGAKSNREKNRRKRTSRDFEQLEVFTVLVLDA